MTTPGRKRLILVLTIFAAVGMLAGLIFWLAWSAAPPPKTEPAREFAGTSALLKQTAVLPTLDAPIPQNRSAIWCISIQLAWNRLRDDVVKEPVKLAGAQKLADRLNQAAPSESDISASDFFAIAGRVDEGIVDKISSGLNEKFPQNSMPAIESFPGGVVAFGYLKADVRYEYQFVNNPEWLFFAGTDGDAVQVRSFGLPELKKGDPLVGGCRDQVRVLFRDGGQFAVDLSSESSPNQIVLAKMPRKNTLAETLAELDAKTAASQPTRLPSSATLLVPNMEWRIEHDFPELAGADKTFQNSAMTGLFLAKAFQFVEFKMDRFGAGVESAFYASAGLNGHDEDTNPNHYHFDRPFLIVKKKRGAQHPFFVMWVDSAELLCRH